MMKKLITFIIALGMIKSINSQVVTINKDTINDKYVEYVFNFNLSDTIDFDSVHISNKEYVSLTFRNKFATFTPDKSESQIFYDNFITIMNKITFSNIDTFRLNTGQFSYDLSEILNKFDSLNSFELNHYNYPIHLLKPTSINLKTLIFSVSLDETNYKCKVDAKIIEQMKLEILYDFCYSSSINFINKSNSYELIYIYFWRDFPSRKYRKLCKTFPNLKGVATFDAFNYYAKFNRKYTLFYQNARKNEDSMRKL